MKDGTYIVRGGVVYKVTPKIKMPISKRVNIMTGEVYYPTNADRIRAMTDEELTRFLYHGGCPETNKQCQTNCEKCWLDWLKEVKE